MFKFIRNRTPHPSAERLRLQKELFAFNKTVAHGFPLRPNCLAFDPKLGLLAIGTRSGVIRVYGKPGVELEAKIDAEIEIRQILFVENRGQLVTLCEDSSIYLWEINSKEDENGKKVAVLEKTKSCETFNKEHREGNLKKPTTLSVDVKSERILVGTQSGNIYMVDLNTLELTDVTIYQDVILQTIPDEQKRTTPGEVETILPQPGNSDKLLIGYNKGLMVLWDNKKLVTEHCYIANQQLESVCWLSNGEQFMSSHNDGGYIVWKASDDVKPSEASKMPYGPFPCRPLTKIVWKTARNSDDFIFVGGGMPRASYSDKNTVSVIQGTLDKGKHHVLDFSSKVIDFVVVDGDEDDEYDNPKALIVLAEEELVAVDLRSEEWLQFRLPYLWSVHSSTITCVQHYSDIPQELFEKIIDAGKKQCEGRYSGGEWPIIGGEIGENNYKEGRDVLITGHEDGSVRFWSTGGVCMQHLYTLQTKKLFTSPDDDIAPIDGDDVPLGSTVDDSVWPPFRKVGTYDPFSDDARLAVRKVTLCPLKNILVVAGTAGQVVVFDLKEDEAEVALNVVPVDIIAEVEGFVWKGHSKLNHTAGNVKLEAGFQPRSILQISPPAAVTALALHSNWSLVAAGTSHGFTILDYLRSKSVMSRSTLKTVDMDATAGGDALISRRKSFKKSLRESFRRLRKGRSQRGKKAGADKSSSPASTSSSPSSSPSKTGETSVKSVVPSDTVIRVEKKTVERQVEARSSEDGMGSMVRCLYFANACITNASGVQTPTMWTGTNAGTVFVFALTVPSDEKRDSEAVTCQLGKEIQLKHKAPVIFIHIVDTLGNPLPEVCEEKSETNKFSTSVPSRVLICSEEQFKLFTLPALKPFCKSKLTAHEGSHARRISIARFVSKSDEKHVENCMMCLSNQGDISIYTLHDLKRQLQTHVIKREDISAISNLAFTKEGEGFYLQSPCEFRRLSLSARRLLKAICEVALPEGCRPVVVTTPPIAAASVVEEPVIEKVEKETKTATIEVKEVKEKTEEKAEEKKDEIEKKEKEEKEIEESEQKEKEKGKTEVTESEKPATLNHETTDGETVTQSTTTRTVTEEALSDQIIVNEFVEEVVTKTVKSVVNGTVDDVTNGFTHSFTSNDTLSDMTIDSVKDHMMNLSETSEIHEISTKKVHTSSPKEKKPVVNSHED